jgi:hypothetical protein
VKLDLQLGEEVNSVTNSNSTDSLPSGKGCNVRDSLNESPSFAVTNFASVSTGRIVDRRSMAE